MVRWPKAIVWPPAHRRTIPTARWTGRGRSSRRAGWTWRVIFNGTLNIDLRPFTFKLVKPEFTFRNVEWTDLHPPENFSFSRCKVIFKDIEYEGWVYYPHPETKLRNFQDPSLLEVIAQPIPEIKYGDEAAGVCESREDRGEQA